MARTLALLSQPVLSPCQGLLKMLLQKHFWSGGNKSIDKSSPFVDMLLKPHSHTCGVCSEILPLIRNTRCALLQIRGRHFLQYRICHCRQTWHLSWALITSVGVKLQTEVCQHTLLVPNHAFLDHAFLIALGFRAAVPKLRPSLPKPSLPGGHNPIFGG